jgi:hypothetical protein
MITWNHANRRIENDDGRSVPVNTDWDFPSVARAFGWDMSGVQVMNTGYYGLTRCKHHSSDGTVRCDKCGLLPGTFINAAEQWLADNDGATASDPGYFDMGEES